MLTNVEILNVAFQVPEPIERKKLSAAAWNRTDKLGSTRRSDHHELQRS